MFAASWYKGDLQARVDGAMEDDTNLPHSDAYTINGQPGDFCPCSTGMFIIILILMFVNR